MSAAVVSKQAVQLLRQRLFPRPTRLLSSPARSTCIPRSKPLSLSWSQSRQIFNSSPAMDRPDPVFAEGVDQELLSVQLRSLIEQNNWVLDEAGTGVTKTYYFKTYTKCLDFTQVVGIRSKSKNHHATITLKAGSVCIHWTTHFPRGLTNKDVEMAQFCDEHAELIGTVEQKDSNKCKPVK